MSQRGLTGFITVRLVNNFFFQSRNTLGEPIEVYCQGLDVSNFRSLFGWGQKITHMTSFSLAASAFIEFWISFNCTSSLSYLISKFLIPDFKMQVCANRTLGHVIVKPPFHVLLMSTEECDEKLAPASCTHTDQIVLLRIFLSIGEGLGIGTGNCSKNVTHQKNERCLPLRFTFFSGARHDQLHSWAAVLLKFSDKSSL